MSALYRTVNARSCCDPSVTQQFNYNFSEFQQSNIPIPSNIFNISFVFSVENPQTGNITCWNVFQTFNYASPGLQFVSTQPYKKCSGCLKDYPCQLYFKTRSCIGNLPLLIITISGDDYYTDSGGDILTGPNGNTFIYDNGHGTICLYLDEPYNGPINPDTIPVVSDFNLGCDNCGEEDNYFYVYNVTQLCCDLHPGYGTSTVLVGPEGGEQGNTLLYNNACWVIQSFYETTDPPSFPIYSGEFYDGCAECIDDGKLKPCELTYRCIRCDGNPGTLIATVPQNIITSDVNGNVIGDGSANVFIYNNICYHLYLPVPFTPSAIIISEFIEGSCVDCRTVEQLVTYRITQICCEFHNNYNQSTQISGDDSGEVGNIVFYNDACWRVVDKYFNLQPVSFPYYYGEFYQDCPECFQLNDFDCEKIEYKIYKAINCCDDTLTFNVGINQTLSISQGIGFLSDIYNGITNSSCYFIQGGGQLPGEFFIDNQEDLINNICNQRICLPCAEGFNFRAVQKCCEFHPDYNQISSFQSSFEPTNGQIFFYNDACWIIDQPFVNQVELDFPFVEEVYDDCPECFEDNNLVCTRLIEYKLRQVCCPTHPEYGESAFMSSPYDYPTGQYVFLSDACWQIVGNSVDTPNPYYYDGDSYSSCEQCWELNGLDCEGQVYEISTVPCCNTQEPFSTMVVDVSDGITLSEGNVISIEDSGVVECFLIITVDLVYGENIEFTIQENNYFAGQTGLNNCKNCQSSNSLDCPTTILQNCVDGLYYSVSFIIFPSSSFGFYPGTTYNMLAIAQGGPEVSTNTCFTAVPDFGQNTLPMLLNSSNVVTTVELGCFAPECLPTPTPTPTTTTTPTVTPTDTPTNTVTPSVTTTKTPSITRTPERTPPATPAPEGVQTWVMERCCIDSENPGLVVPDFWPDGLNQIVINLSTEYSNDVIDTEYYPFFNADGTFPGQFVHLNCYQKKQQKDYDPSVPLHNGYYFEDCNECAVWNELTVACPVFVTPTPTPTINPTPTTTTTPTVTPTDTPEPTRTPGLSPTPLPLGLEKYVLCGADNYDCEKTIYKFDNQEDLLSELFGVSYIQSPDYTNVLNSDSIFVGYSQNSPAWIGSNSQGELRYTGYFNSEGIFEIVTDNPSYRFWIEDYIGLSDVPMEQGDPFDVGGFITNANTAYNTQQWYSSSTMNKIVYGSNAAPISTSYSTNCLDQLVYTTQRMWTTFNPYGSTSTGSPNSLKPILLQGFGVFKQGSANEINFCGFNGLPVSRVLLNPEDPFTNDRVIVEGVGPNGVLSENLFLVSTTNSNLSSGFYTKCGFDRYVHTVELSWPKNDNDFLSIVLGAYNDITGQFGPKNFVHILSLDFGLQWADSDLNDGQRFCRISLNRFANIYGFKDSSYNNVNGEFFFDTPGAVENGHTTIVKKINLPTIPGFFDFQIRNQLGTSRWPFSVKIEKELEIIKIYMTPFWGTTSSPGQQREYFLLHTINLFDPEIGDINESLPQWADKTLLHMFIRNVKWGYFTHSQEHGVFSNIYFSGDQVNNSAVVYRIPDSDFIPEENQTYFIDGYYGCYEYQGQYITTDYDNLPLTFNDFSGPFGGCNTCDPGPEPINACGNDFTSISKYNGIGIYNMDINVGSNIGDVIITIDCNPVPQRFQIFWNGDIVADSLFIGNGLYDTIDSNFYIGQISQNSVLDNFVWNGTEFIQDGTQPYIGNLNNLTDQNATRQFGSVGNQVGVVPSYPSADAFAYDGEIRLRFTKGTPLNSFFTVKVISPINSSFTVQSVSCPEFQVTPNPTPPFTQTPTPTVTPTKTIDFTGTSRYTRFIHIPNL